MKIRVGFVSNSSSQNFIMVGVEVGDINIEDIKKKLIDKCGFKLPDSAESPEEVSIGEITDDKLDEAYEGQYIGILLARGDEYETSAIEFDEIIAKGKELRKVLDTLGYPDLKIKLIAGSEYC